MRATRSAALVVAIVVAATAIAGPAAGAGVVDGLLGDDDAEADAPAMGSQVSAFMQSSAADVNESVEAGMFAVAYDSAADDRRGPLVKERTRALERKLERLETEHEALEAREGELPAAAYDARMTRLAVRIDALERAITETAPRAAEAGVDADALETLRENASKMAGPEVAEVARAISGVEPPRGPPDHAGGNDGDGEDDGNNRSVDRETGSERGPDDADNETDRGPVGDGAPETARSTDGGTDGQEHAFFSRSR